MMQKAALVIAFWSVDRTLTSTVQNEAVSNSSLSFTRVEKTHAPQSASADCIVM